MKFVGEHLLNLDILNLCTLVDLNDLKIHFPSVKEFIAKDVDAGNLNLPNLQDLEIQCTPRTRRGCVKFLRNHSNIRRLDLLT